MRLRNKKMVSLVLALSYLLSLLIVSPALAETADSKTKLNYNVKFKDGEQAKWAFQNISKLCAKGVIKGYSDGSFRPNKPVTRLEALVMVLKTKGVAEQVYDTVQNSAYASFKDEGAIPLWARSYFNLAIEEGYLVDERSGNFQPNKPATRAWVARLMVKVLGLDENIEEKANLELPFTDAEDIDEAYRGHIVLALENNLLQGYPDGTFKPNKPVTRAEMAALLGNADNELDLEDRDDRKIVGTVSSAVYYDSQTPGTIAISLKGGEEATYTLAADVQVFIGGQAATIADIKVNDLVVLVLEGGLVRYIEIKPVAVKGSVVGVVYDTIQIELKKGEVETYKVAEGAEIRFNGKLASLEQIVTGAKVTLYLEGGEATAIKVNKLRVKEKKNTGNSGNKEKPKPKK